MKLLIVRFSSIGDIVLTTPVIRCIKQQIPDVQVHYATKKSYESLLLSNPYIDKLFVLENSLPQLVAELRKERYDYIIDLHHNLRTFLISLQIKGKRLSFNKLNLQKWLFTNLKINQLPKIHIVDRYLDTVKSLGVKNDKLGLDYFIPAKDEVVINGQDIAIMEPYVAFVIGAKFATKQLPAAKIAAICNMISKPIILLGGNEDIAAANQVLKQVEKLQIVNLVGKLNLNQSASVLKQANVVISHDTGLMHIAAAFQKKIVSVWGNTVPDFGMYPYVAASNNKMVEVLGLPCRPCSKIGHKKCPEGHFNCMNLIPEKEIAAFTN